MGLGFGCAPRLVEVRRAFSIWAHERLIQCALAAWLCLGFACSAGDRTEEPFGAESSARGAEVLNPWLLTGLSTPAPDPAGEGGDTLLLAGSDAVILRSSDGGRTFAPAETPGSAALFDLAAGGTDPVRVAVGAEGTILYSRDDGRTWSPSESHARGELRCAAYDPSSGRWVVAGADGQVLVSTDAARTFRSVATPTSALLGSCLVGLRSGGLLLGGEDGALVYSDDRGDTWQQVQSVTAEAVTALISADGVRVYALGSAGSILRSTDGGRSFESFVDPDGRYWTDARHVAALDGLVLIDAHGNVERLQESTGGLERVVSVSGTYLSTLVEDGAGSLLAVGDQGRALHSADAGATWTLIELGEAALLESALYAPASRSWITFGRGGLRARWTDASDEADGWAIDHPDLSRYLHALIRAPRHRSLIGVGSEAAAVRAPEAAASPTAALPTERRFSPVALDVPASTYLYSVAALRSGTVVAAGPSGVVVRSTDGGQTWQSIRQGTEAADGYYHRVVYDATRDVLVVLAGPGRVLRSVDDGRSFEETDADTGLHLFAGTALEPEGVFLAVGQRGSIQRSTDGLHWSSVRSGVARDLYAVARPGSGSSVFALGAGGTLLRSTDAGASWQVLSAPMDAALNALLQTPAGSLIAVGAAGTVLRSQDGGDHWSRVPSPTTEDLRALSDGVRAGVIAAVGRGGTLIASWDDGLTWVRLETHSQGNLKSILPSSAPGWALLSGERLIRVFIPAAAPS